jgi:hypothetical protein
MDQVDVLDGGKGVKVSQLSSDHHHDHGDGAITTYLPPRTLYAP